MLQVAAEVLKQRPEMPLGDYAQIDLNTVGEIDGRLGIAVSQHVGDIGHSHKRIQHIGGIVGGAYQVNVPNRLFEAAKAAARQNAPNARTLRLESRDEPIADGHSARDGHALALCALKPDLARDVVRGLLAKARQRRKPAVVYGGL